MPNDKAEQSYDYREETKILRNLPILEKEEDRPNRAFALEVARNMTREEGQMLYHFAVLVTRLI